MALHDTILKLINKEPKDESAPKPAPGSRSEREAKIKDRAGMVISIFALLLAINSWYGGKLSSIVLNNIPLGPLTSTGLSKPNTLAIFLPDSARFLIWCCLSKLYLEQVG
jgi:hypothetical protein